MCGGKSSRMGFDKAFLPGRDSALLLRQNAQKLAGYFAQVALVSNSREKLAATEALADFAVWVDKTPGAGPLGGICTALEGASTPWVFVMACDMPEADFSLIERMAAARAGAQVVVCRHEGGLEPLFAFYHQSCLPVFLAQMAAQNFRLRAEFGQLAVKTISLAGTGAGASFINLNTRQDLAGWQAKAALLQVPQMVMIGSFGRNSGKTTLACGLIRQWHGRWPIYGLKVVSIDRADGHCHRGTEGCGICTSLAADFELVEESGPQTDKDTSQMLAAGADKVFLLKSLKTALPRAVRAFMRQVPENALIICESNTLRKHVWPGVFLFVARSISEIEGMKDSAREVFHLADRLMLPHSGNAGRVIAVETLPDGRLCAFFEGAQPPGEAAVDILQEKLPHD